MLCILSCTCSALSTDVALVCLTPKLTVAANRKRSSRPATNRPLGVIVEGSVQLTIDDAHPALSDFKFGYYDDPVITWVYPRRSIVR